MMRSTRTAIAALFVFVMSDLAEAKDRPPGSGSTECWLDSNNDTGCGGIICYCCYDNGCWICQGANPDDCSWDPAYRIGGTKPPSSIKPPGPRPPRPGLLETTPGGAQPPSGMGTPKPTAPPPPPVLR
jgi:hypothetical protein